MALSSIKCNIKTDPLLEELILEAEKSPSIRQALIFLIDEERLFKAEFKNTDTVVVHLTDDALRLLDKAKGL